MGEELERVGLAGEAKRRPNQLSGGQQQRVALARALVNRPAVLLLDEPLGALDLKLRKRLQLELKAIQRDVGITFVYVTHDQEEALTMSDRIAVMNRGQVEQVGDPEQVYAVPATTFVAGFIGVSNLMPGTVESEGTDGRVHLDAGVRIGADVGTLAIGDRCHAVVRPEKLRISGPEAAPPSATTASRAWSRARCTWAQPRSSRWCWRATCASPCWCPTPTRSSARHYRGAAPRFACPGPPRTSTWSASPAPRR